ncbi:putative baseplate assembly protein [Herbaspirillum rhizosphaerae]|uniref:putative baseplate assembly protein n=1 Tax=Herbaspirillum rhizosphaerae TaxID=346179 RepID=UPI00067D3A1C|nr:putative baseplate assembly protein [Herbaspirillum rhizosphaerae]
MAARAPVLDPRRAADIRAETRKELYKNLEEYGWSDPHATDAAYGGEACNALVHIFAQYCEHIIDRSNRNRDKSLLAFLDLMGNTLIPAQPARTVVTFTLAAAARGRLLPAGTRLQSMAQGASPGCNFETEHDVWLSNLRLQAMQADTSPDPLPMPASLLSSEGHPQPVPIFDRADDNFYTLTLALADGVLPLEGQPVELHFWLDSPLYDPGTVPASHDRKPLCWTVASGIGATQKPLDIAVEDETAGLTRSGVVRLLTPPIDYWQLGDKPGARWFTLTVGGAQQAPPPQLLGVALNSVPVVQAATIVGEVLGSSAGQIQQRYFATKTPILPDAIVAVLEVPLRNTAQLPAVESNWVVWQEVPDFFGSGPGDRHYVLDHQTGELRFGDGKRGMVPPPGARNVRLSWYRAGGGTSGNVAAGLLTIPVSNTRDIAGVTNFFAASGGSDAESQEQLLDRAPRALRHQQRAVTRDDYEDLALQASTEVARVKCVPLHDLRENPYMLLPRNQEASGAGKVSVIIVPHSAAPQPLPTLELIRRVRDYLRSRACVEAAVEVTGPLYLPVDVKVNLTIESARYADTVKQQVRQRLDTYLHPLTGGRSGKGWMWGRAPKESDFYAVLDGIEHVRHFNLADLKPAKGERKTIEDTRRFLVCAGVHEINID